MTDEERIFTEALAKSSLAERAAYLDEVCCAKVELRTAVEALLIAHENAGAFLRSPPHALVGTNVGDMTVADSPEAPGSVVGRYKLLERIGEGGMGVVYMAEQTEPVQRKVALKIIKPGLDSQQVIARFEAERQALALMGHPNIAKVLDAGTTDNELPYFVMELVRGVPITDYCDDNQLTPQERLGLFLQVCQAVQHAHTKGIIHRDLKPGNILVTLQDGDKPTPKVIDFGIAKATAGKRLTDRTLFTEFRQLVGTPLYMSPEQAEMSAVMDVDTRSDVYSLGVLLYELLTGTTPFDMERLAKAAYDEVRRIIREEEPPRPSTRLSTLGETLATISARRQTDPKKLSQTIKGELDWIVMKALEKDRSRRYETANGLARDVERYLADEPVEASPPSRTYRLRKLAHRYRRPLRVAAAFVLILVAATTVSIWQAVVATRAKAAAVAAEIKAQGEKKRADEQAAVAKAVQEFFNKNVIGQASVYNQIAKDMTPDPDLKVRDALDRAADKIGNRFKDQPLVEAAIRHAIGFAYGGLNELEKAEQHLNIALRLRRKFLGENHADTLETVAAMATLYRAQGLPDKAKSLLEEALKTNRGERNRATLGLAFLLTMLYEDRHDWATAARMARELLDTEQEVLEADDLFIFQTKSNLGSVYLQLRDFRQAESLLKAALTAQSELLGWSQPNTCKTAQILAELYQDQGRYGEAEKLLLQAEPTIRKTFGPKSRQLLELQSQLAQCYEDQGRVDEAASILQNVLEIRQQKFGVQDEQTLMTMAALGRAYGRQGRMAEGEALLVDALRGLQMMPGDLNGNIAAATASLALFYSQEGKFDKAEPLWSESIKASRQAYGPTDPGTISRLAKLALLYHQQRRFKEEQHLLLEGLEEFRKTGQIGQPNVPNYMYLLTQLYNLAGVDPQSVPLFCEQAEWMAHSNRGGDVERTLTWLTNCYHDMGQDEKAKASQEELRGSIEARLVEQTKKLSEKSSFGAAAAPLLYERALISMRLGRFEEALPDMAKSAELDPNRPEAQNMLAYLQLYLKREQDYLKIRGELVRRYGNQVNDRTAKMCLVYAGGPGDPGKVVKMLDAVLATDQSAYSHAAMGMAKYRAGKDAEAIQWLKRSRNEWLKTIADGMRDDRDRHVWDEVLTTTDYFLAMAEYRQGDKNAARFALDDARQELSKCIPFPESASIKLKMWDWLLVQTVAREAENLLGSSIPDDARSTNRPQTRPTSEPSRSQATKPASTLQQ